MASGAVSWGGLGLNLGLIAPITNPWGAAQTLWDLVDFGRGSDGRDGTRLASDRVSPQTRDLPGTDFDNDWAGRAILGRYLTGGDDWNITDDKAWTDYMEANPTLSQQMQDQIAGQAKLALQDSLNGGRESGSFATTASVEIENGESIVGYQYLHGTDANAGGFQHSGTTKVEGPLPDGTYRVTIDSTYQWNDTIDPNPQYSTDTAKNFVAEAITLGRADPYEIHIEWSETTTVVLDENGNLINGEGWPY